MKLTCSFFTHAQDNLPKPFDGTWADLLAILGRTNTPRQVPKGDSPKKGLPAIAGARFDPQHRGKDEAQAIQLLGLDYDNGRDEVVPGQIDKRGRQVTRKVMIENPVTLQEVNEALWAAGVLAYQWTTWSDSAGWPKHRAIVALASPVPADQWHQATEWALAHLGLNGTRRGLDMSALRDVARIYFLPGHPNGADAIKREEVPGDALAIPLEELATVEVPALPVLPHIERERAKRKEEGFSWAAPLPVELSTLRLADLLVALKVPVGPERPYMKQGAKKGSRWRTNCLWYEDHTGKVDDDSGFIIHEAGRWPTWSCSHGCHEGILGLADVLKAAQGDESINLLEYAEPRQAPETEEAEEPGELAGHGATIKRLADLHTLDYEKVRDAEAEILGCRVSVLDGLVKDARPKKAAEGKNGGAPALCPQTDLWPGPVVPSQLLDEIMATIQTFIVCDEEVAIAGTLWASFTWFIDAVQVAPLAVITAPEPRCGKTQFLDLLGRLACRPLVASNISPAAVFRVIEAHKPTLMIDEADSFLKENEELRGVINSGHTRQSAYVIRTVGDDHEPQRFSTWGAKALSGIGHLAGTLMDRAVVLELRRKLKSESVQRLRHANPARFERLASMLATYADAAGAAIQQARPALPDALNDRAQDNWEPLLAIADHAGGRWPGMARAAALKLAGVEQEPMSLAGQLLADIRDAFTKRNPSGLLNPKLPTADLIKELVADDLKPWHTFDHGRQMTPSQLSRMLKPYLIKSKDLKLPTGATLKGYALEQFKDTFDRYLDLPPGGAIEGLPATSEQRRGSEGSAQGIGGATLPLPATVSGSGVAPAPATRNQGATARTAPVLKGSGVAGEVGGGSNETDTFRLPAVSGETFGMDL